MTASLMMRTSGRPAAATMEHHLQLRGHEGIPPSADEPGGGRPPPPFSVASREGTTRSTSGTGASSRSSTSPPTSCGSSLRLSADLKAAKYGGHERPRLVGKNIALIFEKTSTRTRTGVRGRRPRPGRACHLPGAERVPDRPQGVHEGHRPGARADLRRHRVPGLRAGDGRDPRQVRRRPGVERADRRVPPHPDPGRHPHDDRAQRQAPARDRLLLPGRRPQQHGQLADGRRLQARHGRPAVRPRAPVARRGPGQDLPRDRRGDRRPADPHRGRGRGRGRRRLPLHRRVGLDG